VLFFNRSRLLVGGRRDRDRMVVWFTTTYAISAYHHWCCEFESRSGRGIQHYLIKFVSDLRQVGGFLRILLFSPPIKLTATLFVSAPSQDLYFQHYMSNITLVNDCMNVSNLRVPDDGYSRNSSSMDTKFEIYIFITITGSTPLLVDY